MRTKFENWVVDEPRETEVDEQNFQKQLEHLKDIHFATSSTGVSLLIEDDMPELYLPSEIRNSNENEPIGTKLVLGWV